MAVYRELTPRAFVLGVLQGIILNLAFVYCALKLGFALGGSTVAAILGFVFLRGVLKDGTSVENNLNQTVASGINTVGTGIVYTLPAMFLLSAKGSASEFTIWPYLLGAIAGSILGVAMIIPLRKQMIELDRLRFPSGVATATIIRSPAAGMEKARLLLLGALLSAVWKFMMDLGWFNVPGLIADEELNFGLGIIPNYASPVVYLSLMNFGAGLLAGKGGLPFLAGGILSYWIAAPSAVAFGWVPESVMSQGQAMGFLYGKMFRPLGIGALVGGALMGVLVSLPAMKAAFASLARASQTKKAGAIGTDEITLQGLLIGAGVGTTLLFFASILSGVGVYGSLVSAIVGTAWLGLAGIIVAQATGMTDISPMSGMALISVTLMMFLLENNVLGAMVVGVAVCVAIGMAADMMQDLKTGFILGARPVKQQIAQFTTSWIGALVGVGCLLLLWSNGPGGQGGFGPGTKLPAPQAGALMGIIETLQTGNVPVDKYSLGAVIGGLLGFAPFAGLGVLVGLALYLPFSITLGYGIGNLAQMAIQRKMGREFAEHKIVPFAAGLIVGEAIMGIGSSLYQIIQSSL